MSNVFTAKYVDDSSRARAINLQEDLVINDNLTRPLNYHERTGHILDPNRNFLQQDLDHFNDFLSPRNQVINIDKSSIMLFSLAKVEISNLN